MALRAALPLSNPQAIDKEPTGIATSQKGQLAPPSIRTTTKANSPAIPATIAPMTAGARECMDFIGNPRM